ncbi:tRNA 2-selenouridine(34) synthase MnmH [Brevundimonas sp. 2R-24]|uniref:tRNA 2-selenouridine(34) synthase MnmH n=1 Tax=Peiella sedimenti TaxID=3061083 RepID=A0ABT8SMR2_9CAUL|nr:tRNA 2-selenouridine(34) synthase MnmH [Caulobacteraceae bacterium XZ-24]
MIRTVDRLAPADLDGFDAVIDVRSPSEFAEDHVPGAMNLPVLSDAERAEVGTIYVQQSKFLARRIGAALVARNIARHLETALADRPGGFRPLVYCWRGGQRSHAMATVLDQVGWPVTLLQGGYRTWRRGIVEALYEGEPRWRVILLDGGTGSAKTDILNRLAVRGVQTLDLEGLAEHRGSLFGGLPGAAQPSQKLFESRLHMALAAVDPARPLVLEAESSKVGERMIPPALWAAMTGAPRIELSVPLAARAAYSAEAYGEWTRDRAALNAVLARLPVQGGRALRKTWGEMADAGDWTALAADLIERHYDPAYAKQGRGPAAPLSVIPLADLGEAERERAADEIAALLADQK